MSALESRVGWVFGTGLGTGLFPVAPATFAALAAILIYGFAPLPEDSFGFYLLIGLGFFLGVWATGTLLQPDDLDPSRAVWDEFIGMWATCLLLPKTLPWLLAAFFVFRVLDIVKPWPIRKFERFPSGWGIMADDLAAGVMGATALNIIHRAAF